MRCFKSLTAIICVFAMLFTSAVSVAAVPEADCSYTSEFDNRQSEYTPPRVEESTIEDGCLYYAILSTAGSYAKTVFQATDDEADFSEENLKKTVENPDVHNFGDMLYKSIGCDIGNKYAITSVEFLTGRGDRYLKEKIKENGAIVAAIAIPEDGGLNNPKYFNDEKNNFVYVGNKNDKYHALSIVGWDDNYDLKEFNKDENGKNLAKKKGAWICKNSDGEDFGDNGYFYLSYYTPIVYSAALEVSRLKGLDLAVSSGNVINRFGYIYGVNIRSYMKCTQDITINVGKKTIVKNVELKNGCNLVLFDRPVRAGKVRVKGENISTDPNTVYCYFSLIPKNRMSVKQPAVEQNWILDSEKISINLNDQYCKTSTIRHDFIKNSNDGCYYIIPADGYRFTGNTKILLMDGFDRDDLRDVLGADYKPFTNESTIQDAVNADYKRLTDGNGNYIKMIDFDPDWDGGRGRLKIASQNTGGAFVKNVNILTDENGEIINTILTFDDGSVIPYKATVSLYRDSDKTEKIESISGLEEYCAELTIHGYYANDYTVSINGVVVGTETADTSGKISFSIKIVVPDITMSGWDSLKDTFVDVSNAWTGVGDNLRRFLKALFKVK